jgi:CRISPR/Cas system-associated endonuclease/helicase Cas3
LRYSELAPVDREVQYQKIKNDMSDRKPIIVVGTQGCDVGLDLDFHDGFKEQSTYNSTLQMRGRINRNGRFKTSKQIIFKLVDCPLGNGEKLYNNPSIALETEVLEEEFDNFREFSPELCSEITSLEIGKMTEGSRNEMKMLMGSIDSLDFETVSKNFKLIKMPVIKLLINPEVYRKMIRGEYVSYAEIQGNIVNVIVSRANMNVIKELAVPMTKNKEDKTDKKYYLVDTYREDIENEDENDYEDYYDMYFWTGEYDNDKYGIYKGIKSGKIVNIPVLIV